MTGNQSVDDADPRLETEYVRTVDGGANAGSVTLVGVVHDHPASAFRVQSIVDAAAPEVLALELPPLAVPLYEAYATDGSGPPDRGGELSAAVAAAETDDVVGIDGPSLGFCRTLLGRLHRERASLETARDSLRSLAAITRTALTCRAAAALATRTRWDGAVGSQTPHDVSREDSPADQAADERRQIRAASAVMDAFETAPSTQYRAESRESHMAERIRTLRERGDVVAVVGAGHFDPLCARLADD